MARTSNKTKETNASVILFINGVKDAQQREDAATLAAMMQEIAGEVPRMWGASIIGFGKYRYRYESGREGEICKLGFSPRAGKIAIYGLNPNSRNLEALGKHQASKGCLYVKRLSDVNLAALAALFREAWKSPTPVCD